ncbi:MAG: NB-ARC domain protein [Gemmataceae bacterium]|nr:NB-ARC domain protein [Gemmataceae bacterium]MDW8266048.1 c-type cytochrome domain-containing protein [Gemmataceae bacterium]
MRWFLVSALVALWSLAPLRAEDKKAKDADNQPIKVIQLNRTDPVSYEKEIEPILVNKCVFCHSGPVKEGKLDLASYDSLMRGGKSGKPIVPGKAEESRLYKLCAKTQKPFMPPKTEEPLTPEELALIRLWIDQGAKPPSGQREKPKVVLSGLPPAVQPVRAVVISPDKKSIVVGRANQIHVYDAATGDYQRSFVDPGLLGPDKQPLKAAHISLVESLAFSPDGKTVASGSFQEVVLWDFEKGESKNKLTGFAERVVALAFSKDGKLLATGGGAPTEEGEIKVFEADSGKLVVDIKNGHSDTVFGVCFSPDGTKLATCGADKFVKVFELPEGKFLKSFEGHTHHVLDVGWKGDGKVLASAGADNVVKLWDYEKGEQIRTINAHGKQVTRLQFVGSTNQFVTCSGDQTVKMWNADNGGSIRNFGGGGDFLYAVSVSADGQLLAAGGEDGLVRTYNGQNGQLLKTLNPPPPPASPK